MNPFRDTIRIGIFEKIQNNRIDLTKTAVDIAEILLKYGQRYPDFYEKEKLNIELTIPIRLPPGGKEGDCEAVIMEVTRAFNELGGGSSTQSAIGSWLDDEKRIVDDDCIIVFTAMPIKNWYTCIPELERLIKDEIQSKLFQQCVFLRIDNQTYGEPINLIGEEVESFPGIDEFGGIDPSCRSLLMGKYEEWPIESVVNHSIQGDGNVQVHTGDDSNNVIGDQILVQGENITIQQGLSHEKYSEIMAQNYLLEKQLESIKEQDTQDTKRKVAEEATRLAQEMVKEDRVDFSPKKMLELGIAAMLAMKMELAEGYLNQTMKAYKNINDKKGEADAVNALGRVAKRRGRIDEAEKYFQKGLKIRENINDLKGISASLNNLGLIENIRGNLDEAERLHRKSLKIKKTTNDQKGISSSLNNLGNVFWMRGELDEAEKYFQEALLIKRKTGSNIPLTLLNLGRLKTQQGDLDEAEKILAEHKNEIRGSFDLFGQEGSDFSHACLSLERGDFDEAERRFEALLAFEEENLNRPESKAAGLFHLADVSLKKGDLDEAERRFEALLAFEEENLDRPLHKASTLFLLADVSKKKGDLDEAERRFEALLAFEEENLDRPESKAAALFYLANIAEEQDDLDEAERRFEALLAIEESMGRPGGIASAMLSLLDITLKQGDLDEAERRFEALLAFEEENLNRPEVLELLSQKLKELINLRDSEGKLELNQTQNNDEEE